MDLCYRKEGLLYKGTCLTCLKQGPSSEIDKDVRVKILLASSGKAMINTMIMPLSVIVKISKVERRVM